MQSTSEGFDAAMIHKIIMDVFIPLSGSLLDLLLNM